MTTWTLSMYGVGGSRTGQDWQFTAGDPWSPIGPGVSTQDAWWFRGPSYRALAPAAGQVTSLPAGGTIVLEIACHVAWTKYGWSTTVPGSPGDACPSNPAGNFGPYHANNDPNAPINPSLVAGCALGIANVDDIAKTTMDNIVIFSVQPNCVTSKQTSFDIPAMMPACTGSKCICGWFWLAETGTANFYMTAFDCNVTNVSPLATPIAPPQDAVFCAPGNSTCTLTKGAKRPMYAYNTPTNVYYPGDPSTFNANRPGYHSTWSWPNAGAQNDIFLPATAVVATASQVQSVSAPPTSQSVSAASSGQPVSAPQTSTSVSAPPASTSVAATKTSMATAAATTSTKAPGLSVTPRVTLPTVAAPVAPLLAPLLPILNGLGLRERYVAVAVNSTRKVLAL